MIFDPDEIDQLFEENKDLLDDDWYIEAATRSGDEITVTVERLRYEWGDWRVDTGVATHKNPRSAILFAIEDALMKCNYADHTFNRSKE